jgi:hypothetical protein
MHARTYHEPRLPSPTGLGIPGHFDGVAPGLPAFETPPPGAMMASLRLKMPEVVLYGRYTMPVTSASIGLAFEGAARGKVEVVCHADI